MPPRAQIKKEIQNGKPVHQPIMIRPGSTKMIDDKRARGRGHRLHDVVFLNGRVAETAQDRHRNHRRRNRCRKSQTSLETEVNVGRGEDQRDEDSDDQPADGKFLAHIR